MRCFLTLRTQATLFRVCSTGAAANEVGFFRRFRSCAAYPTSTSSVAAWPPRHLPLKGEGLKSPRAPLRFCYIAPLPLTHRKTATTPQAEACGVASAYPRLIPSEAGLAPSGSPAVPAHGPAVSVSSRNSDNPAGRSLRGCLSMTLQAQRSVFLNRDAGELRRGQITPTALPSSRQTAS